MRKIDWGLNAIFALLAPIIHLTLPGKESVTEAITACIIIYAICYVLMCCADAVVVWLGWR